LSLKEIQCLHKDHHHLLQKTKLRNWKTHLQYPALGKEAQFLYSTIDTYIEDARKDNNSELENMWKTIKEERKRHLAMLRDALEKQAKGQKLH
jgi:rubrerythrin